MKLNRMETYYFSRSFTMADMTITPIYVRVEQLQPTIPAHQHSVSSYEIHYCKSGSGKLIVGDQTWHITANTIFVTGPGVIHAQLSPENDPLIEHCLFLDCKHAQAGTTSPLHLFAKTTFWIGEDPGCLNQIIEQLLNENREPDIDTVELSEALLREFIVRLTRIYRESILTSKQNNNSTTNTPAIYITLIDDVFAISTRALPFPNCLICSI